MKDSISRRWSSAKWNRLYNEWFSISISLVKPSVQIRHRYLADIEGGGKACTTPTSRHSGDQTNTYYVTVSVYRTRQNSPTSQYVLFNKLSNIEPPTSDAPTSPLYIGEISVFLIYRRTYLAVVHRRDISLSYIQTQIPRRCISARY